MSRKQTQSHTFWRLWTAGLLQMLKKLTTARRPPQTLCNMVALCNHNKELELRQINRSNMVLLTHLSWPASIKLQLVVWPHLEDMHLRVSVKWPTVSWLCDSEGVQKNCNNNCIASQQGADQKRGREGREMGWVGLEGRGAARGKTERGVSSLT